MNLLQRQITYDLEDLGMFETGPDRDFEAVAAAAAGVTGGMGVLTMIDPIARSVVIKSTKGCDRRIPKNRTVELMSSVTSQIVETSEPKEGEVRTSANDCSEFSEIKGVSYLGMPICDPVGAPVGAIFTLAPIGRTWSAQDRAQLQNVAYLGSQQILLRASLATIRLMAKDMKAGGARSHAIN